MNRKYLLLSLLMSVSVFLIGSIQAQQKQTTSDDISRYILKLKFRSDKEGKKNERIKETRSIIKKRVETFGFNVHIKHSGEKTLKLTFNEIKKSNVPHIRKLVTRKGTLECFLEASKVMVAKAGKPVDDKPHKHAPNGTIWLPIHEEVDDSTSGTGNHEGYLLVEKNPVLIGNHLRKTEIHSNNDIHSLYIHFTKEGTKRFARITKQNVDRQLAIAVDGKIFSAPNIMEPITEGTAAIRGSFSKQEVKRLKSALNSGTIPGSITITDEKHKE